MGGGVFADNFLTVEATSRTGLCQRLKGFGERTISRLGSGLSLVLKSPGNDALGILSYHRITPISASVGSVHKTRGAAAPTWNVTPARFRAQLQGLLARGHQPCSLRLAVEASRLGRPFPRKAFVVTFDDGYASVYCHAWPILRELGIPATVFLPTAYLDQTTTFPYDDWSGAGSPDAPPESWRMLTVAQCQEMLAGGLIDLGSHTHTHAIFCGRPEAFSEDLAVSLGVLRERFGLETPTFSFPFGINCPQMNEVVRRAGVSCALSTAGGVVRSGQDPFTWARFAVNEEEGGATLSGKLLGWYDLVRDTWRRVRHPFARQQSCARGAECLRLTASTCLEAGE